MNALRLANTKDMEKDEWLDVVGFEGLYKVSSKGELISSERNGTKGGILKTYLDRYGYEKVVLHKQDKPYYFTVHRLVARAFISNELNKSQVNHKNGVRTDNRVENLEWVTPKENVHHSFQFGKQTTEMKTIKAIQIKTNNVYVFPSQREAEKVLGVSQANISKVLLGKYKQCSGYQFEYFEGELA